MKTLIALSTTLIAINAAIAAIPGFEFNTIVCNFPREDKGILILNQFHVNEANNQLSATATISQKNGMNISGEAAIRFTAERALYVTAFDSLTCHIGPYNEAGKPIAGEVCWNRTSPNAEKIYPICTASK